ncbi:hypothetical protein WEH80_26550 [Actinomycetes bacterium KLBMP 9759]
MDFAHERLARVAVERGMVTADRPRLRMPADVWLPVVAPRRPGDPVADLTLSKVLHRARAADLGPLADAAIGIDAGAPRATAVSAYLRGVLAAVGGGCQVEDGGLCPLLLSRAGPLAHDVFGAAAADHARIVPLLAEVTALAEALVEPGGRRVGIRVAASLRELDMLLRMHCADHELRIFPLIRRHVTAVDQVWLQRQFHRALPAGQLGFVVPWLGFHASPSERERLVEAPHQHVRAVERIFRRRFEALRLRAIGVADAPITERSAPRP